MSVATARNGMRSWSKFVAEEHGIVAVSSTKPSLLPAIRPGGRRSPPFLRFRPNSKGIRRSKSSSFCRKDWSLRSGASWKSVSHGIEPISFSISSGV